MNASAITNDTPIMYLTVGQLVDIIQKEVGNIEVRETNEDAPEGYGYGLSCIMRMFEVSHATAQKLKDDVLQDAVSQKCRGGQILVNISKAKALYAAYKGR